MTNRIVAALEHAATKLGKTLGEDAGKAVKDLYHSTGHNLKGIAEDTAAADLKHETNLRNLMHDSKQTQVHAPHHVADGHFPREEGDEPPLGGEHAPGQPSEGNSGCTTGGDPVDVVSGQMITSATDIDLPGLLPLILRRAYASGYTGGRWFGPGWASTLDQRVQVDADGIHYAGQDAEIQHYPLPTDTTPSVLPVRGPQRPLSWDRETDTVRIEDTATGVTRHFGPPAHDPYAQTRTITALSDRNGHRIDYLPGPDGLPSEVRHTGGYRIAVDTTPTPAGPRIAGLRLLHDGTSTQILQYGYDGRGRLTGITDSTGLPLTYAYDDHDRITSWTDRNNHWYAYEYGPDSRVTRSHGPQGALEAHFAHDTRARVTTVTDSLGARTEYHYDHHGHITTVIDPLGNTARTEYDSLGRLLARTDQLGHTTRLTRDGQGDVIGVDRPDGTVVRIAYDAQCLPIEVVAPDGATWRQAFDARGNRTEVTDAAGATTRFTYDSDGHLTSITGPAGNTTTVHCDAAGLPVEVTDPLGAVTRYRRDAFGRIIAVTDPLGRTTGYTWSVEGRPLTRIEPDGATHVWDHDPEGNTTRYTDPSGAVTALAYTHFGLATERTDPDGARYTFAYDTELRLVQVTQPQGLTWSYRHDAGGRVVSETDFDGRTLAYAYDAAGRLTARTNGLGQTIAYGLDPLGRVVRKDANGAVTQYAYDRAGRLLSARDDLTELAREYDSVGRLLSEAVDGRTLTLAYDSLGRLTRRRTPSGSESRWTYDLAGNPASLDTAGHRIDFDHDATGQETLRRLGPELRLAFGWDTSYRLTDQTLSSTATAAGAAVGPDPEHLLHRSYAYRPDGNLISVTSGATGLSTDAVHYDLDPAGRVTAVHGSTWSEQYVYDRAGHPITADLTDAHSQAGHGPRTYDGARLRTAGRLHYSYDAQGRVTTRRRTTLSGRTSTWTYSWDAEDRLTDVTTPDGQRWHYRYDPLGRRISKQHLVRAIDDVQELSAHEWTHYTWHGPTLVEQTAHGPHLPGPYTLTWDYRGLHPITQHEQLASSADQDEVDRRFFAIVTDLIGTPTHLYSPDGSLAWQQRTTVWGAPVDSTAGQTTTPLRLPGQYCDPESGLHYNLHRYYDPTTARYLSPDPLGLAPAPDPYAYVDNPLLWTDPLGLTAHCGTGGAGSGQPGDPLYSEIVNGRAGPAYATVTPQVLDDAANNRIGSAAGRRYRPAGYAGDAAGHSRGHLIGRQFGGSGRDLRNLVTQSEVHNNGVISDFEDGIADHVRTTGNTVIMSVTPQYDYGGVIPSHVLIEAVDDSGWSVVQRLPNI